MPKITYKPEGAEPRVWTISFGRFMSAERIVIERETGMTWAQVKGRLFMEDTAVTRAFLFVLLKREISDLKINQVEFCEDDYELDATAEERAQAIEALEARTGDLSDDELNALEELRREQAADLDAPKEPASTSSSDSDS
ncbi:hypothetical protein [Nocardioides sp.]|uniref:hypothetical protein n=1 Tax=Nocardioides sp. TaxID=35761 RepID=UPI0035B40A42